MTKLLTVMRSAFLPIFFLALAFTACEGPKGADGATGATGPQGPQGPAGPSGAQQCGVCHNNSTLLFAKQSEWAQSLHGTGEMYVYGNQSDCAYCHTSQGFLEYNQTGVTPVTGAPYSDPATINCRTCHNVHTNYDSTDWGLKRTVPVAFYAAKVASADLGKGNLCGQCHQARPSSTPIDLTNPDATISITDMRLGAHHSPAANVFTGSLQFVPNGNATVPTSNYHSMVKDACVTCHMADTYVAHGQATGGHTFKTVSDDGTIFNTNACKACHTEVTNLTNFNQIGSGFTDQFQTDMDSCATVMIAKGWMTASKNWNASSSKPLVVTQNQAAAMYAYNALQEDKSKGVHNPKYARAVLDNIMHVLGIK